MSVINIIIICGILCLFVIGITITIMDHAYTKWYKNKLNQTQKYGKYIESFENFPYLMSCPSCGSDNIYIARTMDVPDVKTYNGNIEFYPTDIHITYKAICPKCGMQTTGFSELSKAITNWNTRGNKSDSTEVIKYDN